MKMTPPSSSEDIITYYGLMGGIPYYLEQLRGCDLRSNISDNYLSPVCPMSAEPTFLFITEFRRPDTYLSVLNATGRGNRAPDKISQASGITSDNAEYALDVLEGLRFVGSRRPYGEKGGKKTRYFISDMFLRSYFTFVYPRFTDISVIDMDRAYGYMTTHMSEYLGHVFEDICERFVKKSGFWNISSWWDKNDEIYIVAEKDDIILFCDCRYRNELQMLTYSMN